MCLQFSEIMDKISGYIGKQRKNSEGEFTPFLCVCCISVISFYNAVFCIF